MTTSFDVFTVQTLRQVEQQGTLARTLGTFKIGLDLVSETPKFVISLRSSYVTLVSRLTNRAMGSGFECLWSGWLSEPRLYS